MPDHLQRLHLFDESVSNALHELLDVALEDPEQQLRIQRQTPLLKSPLHSQQLLEVLLNVIVVVNAVKAELYVRLDLLIPLD